MNVVLLGPPGSGKGTQGKIVTNQFNLISVIAGDILRAEKRSGSKLGDEIKEIIDKGNLVPDEMIDTIMDKFLINCGMRMIKTGFVFDGYPRTLGQAEYLDKICEKYETQIDLVFFFDVEKEVLIKRILERGKTSGREDDKDKNIISKRMDNYDKLTAPVKDYYKEKLVVLDGSKSIDDINQEIRTVMTKKFSEKFLKSGLIPIDKLNKRFGDGDWNPTGY
ncbi:MAG: Adenylate kinase [uncultured marine phage]|uniref:Adenylate kinase n=1 Tax=uncultured marine phage TaxID=707152 RepID=A0A8D9CE10_9VIRU|nr:MAG: Adenylate kinase [uncultured marine phage]